MSRIFISSKIKFLITGEFDHFISFFLGKRRNGNPGKFWNDTGILNAKLMIMQRFSNFEVSMHTKATELLFKK